MAAVAPMDLVVRINPASIPLQCTLCPKKPKFSDLSHLLTHISSKSHLAHRFKAELRARDDTAALEEVRQYDNWCEQYGINALLAERMAAKEQKRTGRRARPSTTGNNKPNAVASHHHMVKADPDEFIESLPGSAHWATAPDHFQEGHNGHFDHSVYHTPNMKRLRSDPSVPSTPDNEPRVKYYRRWPSEAETADSVLISDRSESTEFDDDDASKLKGVRYPGMGLFDSADETQKRMRNQRKDDSVLKSMEETSSGIVPNEFVWTENGDFQRIRDIYASPSIEGSPVRRVVARDAHKPKRGRRSTAAAGSGPARSRTSARTTRLASRNKPQRGKPSLLEQDDNDGLPETADCYDIFHDPPKPSPARTESPLRESRFDLRGLRRRPALQSLNPNVSLVSPAQKPGKALSYISPQDAGAPSFTSQPPIPNSHYFQQHTMGTGTFNPLCVQARGGYYNPYNYSNFGDEAKPSTLNFPTISAMNLGSMPFNAFGGPFVSDSAHERVDQDFDL